MRGTPLRRGIVRALSKSRREIAVRAPGERLERPKRPANHPLLIRPVAGPNPAGGAGGRGVDPPAILPRGVVDLARPKVDHHAPAADEQPIAREFLALAGPAAGARSGGCGLEPCDSVLASAGAGGDWAGCVEQSGGARWSGRVRGSCVAVA